MDLVLRVSCTRVHPPSVRASPGIVRIYALGDKFERR
jgi:hypothetical protein